MCGTVLNNENLDVSARSAATLCVDADRAMNNDSDDDDDDAAADDDGGAARRRRSRTRSSVPEMIRTQRRVRERRCGKSNGREKRDALSKHIDDTMSEIVTRDM
jgi:hypothetical protein